MTRRQEMASLVAAIIGSASLSFAASTVTITGVDDCHTVGNQTCCQYTSPSQTIAVCVTATSGTGGTNTTTVTVDVDDPAQPVEVRLNANAATTNATRRTR